VPERLTLVIMDAAIRAEEIVRNSRIFGLILSSSKRERAKPAIKKAVAYG